MSAILIYAFPAVMDTVLASVLFMTTVWAARQGATPSQVSNLITAWSVVYMVSALGAGRLVTKRNAAYLLVAACGLTGALSLLLAGVRDLRLMYVLVSCMGVTMAAFFTPFQVFMKAVGERKQRLITVSIGLYTCSWSSGFAIGPFLAGWLWEPLGWSGYHLVNACTCAVVAVALFVIHRRLRRQHAEAGLEMADKPPLIPNEYAAKPDLAWMSWVFGGIGCVAITVIRSVFPTTGQDCAIPRFEQGLVLGLLSAVQAVVGLALGAGRWWMYRPLPIIGFGLCGTAALAIFATSRTTTGFLVAAVLFGVYSGSFFFYFVFHSLVHPERAAGYISINEAVVGLMCIIGAFAGGLLAKEIALPAPYVAAGALVLAGIATQAFIHARLERRSSGMPMTSAHTVPEQVRS